MTATFLGLIRPTEDLINGGWTPFGGAAQNWQALESFLDSYYSVPSVSGGTLKVGCGLAPMLDPFTHVKFVRIHVTGQVSSEATPTTLRVDLGTSRGAIPVHFSGFWAISYVTFTTDIAYPPSGGAWTEEDLNELTLSLTARLTGPTLQVGRLYIGVWGNTAPITATLGPGTVTTTSFPDLEWAYDDAEEDPQEEVEIKLFTGGSFVVDPSTEVERLYGELGPFFFSDTMVQSSAVRNGSYRWAVRARDVGSGPEDWGPWGQGAFTVDNPAPPAPVATVTPDATNNRYVITISAGTGPHATQGFLVERSDDSGLTWDVVRDASAVPWSGTEVTIYDYEAPRMASVGTPEEVESLGYNAPVGYNEPVGYNQTVALVAFGPQNPVLYRFTAYRTPSLLAGTFVYSAYAEVAPDALLGNGTTWLKHPTDPSKNIVIQHMADWESTSEEDLVALRASGRADWVVLGDVPSLEKGDLDITFPGDAAWLAFEALRSPASGVAESLLLQTCFGDTTLEQHWVRLGAARSVVRVTHVGQNTLQYRRCKVGFYETQRPATV